MIYLSGVVFILGLPLLIVYALQDREEKNRLWLRLGLIYMAVAIVLFIVGLLNNALS